MNFFNRSRQKTSVNTTETAQTASTSEPGGAQVASAPVETVQPDTQQQSDDMPPIINTSSDSVSTDIQVDMMPEFYGSYGEVCNDVTMSQPTAQPEPSSPEKEGEMDFSVPDFDIPDTAAPTATEQSEKEEEFNPILNFPETYDSSNAGDSDDELVLPDIPMPQSNAESSKKSMSYEVTVKLKDAHTAYGNETRINEPIRSGAVNTAPKSRDYTVVASGTAHVSGDLPKLKDGEMYVAITPKELRRLKSRRFRGLGVVATLCLVIISSFCIWSYANSFTDPLVGVWKGDVSTSSIPIEQLQQMDQKIVESTWEFSSSGSMYLNIVVNETPISISGTYEQKKDGNGEPYIVMTLANPMDSTNYAFNMYYTVTGKILEFSDMEGMGISIDLVKE